MAEFLFDILQERNPLEFRAQVLGREQQVSLGDGRKKRSECWQQEDRQNGQSGMAKKAPEACPDIRRLMRSGHQKERAELLEHRRSEQSKPQNVTPVGNCGGHLGRARNLPLLPGIEKALFAWFVAFLAV